MEQFNMFMSNPDIDLCLKVYNIPETDFVQTLTEVTLPSIKLHQIIYLPMVDDILTIEGLEEIANQFQKKWRVSNIIDDNIGKNAKKEKELKKSFDIPKNEKTKRSSIGMELMKSHYIEELQHAKNPMYLTKPQLYKPDKHVMVRILSPIEFPVDWKNRMVKHEVIAEAIIKKKGYRDDSFSSSNSKRASSMQNPIQENTGGFFQWWCLPPFQGTNIKETRRTQTMNDNDRSIDIDAIMIHIHGGGFVAMSSASHQTYTRKWANEVGIPIFSIDYRLAPEHAYPAALNDVWQAYYWIINHCETHFGIKPKKIFVAGDSAGGNLTVALTMLWIEKGFRVPDFILPSYPALNLSLRNFSPSLILSLDDFILPSSFLMLCLDSYVKDGNPEKDHFLSPAICPDNVLAKFPPVRILIAGNDPLRDESYKFTLRLLKNDIDVKVFEFICFPHGFLSYELPLGGIEECSKCNEQAIKYFKEFLPTDDKSEPSEPSDTVVKINKKMRVVSKMDIAHDSLLKSLDEEENRRMSQQSSAPAEPQEMK